LAGFRGTAVAPRVTGVPPIRGFPLFSYGDLPLQVDTRKGGRKRMSILWIILIVILVLALLGFFSRGRW
jgi:hypothetical protein